jgi:hypothetical protein
MVGDYISTSFSGENAISVFAVGQTGFAGVLNEGMFASVRPVTAAQLYPLKVANDPVLSTRGDRPLALRPITTP